MWRLVAAFALAAVVVDGGVGATVELEDRDGTPRGCAAGPVRIGIEGPGGRGEGANSPPTVSLQASVPANPPPLDMPVA